MAITPIRIRVGASLDSSVDEVFGSVEKRAKRAAEAVARSTQSQARETQRAAARTARMPEGDAAKRHREAMKEIRQRREMNRLFEREMKEMGREFEQEQKRRTRVEEREQANRARTAERMRKRAISQQKREEVSYSRELDRFATRTSHRFTRFLTPNLPILGAAKRLGGDLLRGVGVDTSVSSSVGRNVDLQKAAIGLSNQGFMPGDRRNGRRVASGDLIATARDVAESQAMDAGEAMAGMEKFVTKTGDLATAREILKDMAALAGATGANLEDTVDAAGDVANALGDIPNKGQAIGAIMRTIAGQGKVGAVEMKDMASQMAKIASAAGAFGGDQGNVIVELGALAQMSRKKGGAASATQAATSVAGFANILKTPKRREAFKAAGISLEDAQGMLRDPLAILKESIAATNGDVEPLKKMWANIVGAKPVEGLANVFKQAGRGKAGMAAIDKELAPFLEGAAISQKQIRENNAERMQSTSSKVQQFQNQLDKITESAASELLPALEQLAPAALTVAKTLADLATFAAKNPFAAIITAAVAALARAGVESTIRGAIDRTIRAGNGFGMVGGAGAGGAAQGGFLAMPSGAKGWGGAFMNALGPGLTLGSIAAAGIYSSGTMGFDSARLGTNQIMKDLKDVHGSDLGLSLAQAKDALQKQKDDTSFLNPLLELFGAGNSSEINGAEDFINRKQAEYDRFSSGKETAAERATRLMQSQQAGAQQQKVDAETMGRTAGETIANQMTARTQRVFVANAKEIGLTSPKGREAN